VPIWKLCSQHWVKVEAMQFSGLGIDHSQTVTLGLGMIRIN